MSWQARILKTLMRYQMAYLLRSDDPLIRRARIETAAGYLKSPPDVVSEPVSAGGVPSEWITTPAADHEQVILHLHSGGYYTGSINTHRDLVARLGRAARMRALAIDYRLAPEHPYPAALEDATTAYRWLVATGYKTANIIIAGDSSGGQRAITAAPFRVVAGVFAPPGAPVLPFALHAPRAPVFPVRGAIGSKDPEFRDMQSLTAATAVLATVHRYVAHRVFPFRMRFRRRALCSASAAWSANASTNRRSSRVNSAPDLRLSR